MTDFKRNCLLVGSSGRVGRLLERSWNSVPPTRMNLIRQSRSGQVGDTSCIHWAPVEQGEQGLRQVLAGAEIHVMVVLAGATPGPGVDLSLNKRIAESCLEAADAIGCRRVLLASSSAVYGAYAARPFREGDATQPVNDYGRSKLDMEAICAPWRERGLEVCCLRIGNVAGADALLLNARQASRESPLQLDQFADGGGPVRSYIGAATMANVLESLACHSGPLPDLLNVASPSPVSMQGLVEAAGVAWRWKPAPATALQYITLDCGRLQQLHDFAEDDSNPRKMVSQWLG